MSSSDFTWPLGFGLLHDWEHAARRDQRLAAMCFSGRQVARWSEMGTCWPQREERAEGGASTIQQGGGPDGKDAMLRLLNYVQPQISLLQNRNRPRGEKKKEKKRKKES